MVYKEFCFLDLQVVEEYKGPAPPDSQNEGFCIVLANEDDMDSCAPLLEQGSHLPPQKNNFNFLP